MTEVSSGATYPGPTPQPAWPNERSLPPPPVQASSKSAEHRLSSASMAPITSDCTNVPNHLALWLAQASSGSAGSGSGLSASGESVGLCSNHRLPSMLMALIIYHQWQWPQSPRCIIMRSPSIVGLGWLERRLPSPPLDSAAEGRAHASVSRRAKGEESALRSCRLKLFAGTFCWLFLTADCWGAVHRHHWQAWPSGPAVRFRHSIDYPHH